MLTKSGERIKLTQIEYTLIKLFMSSAGKPLRRDEILSAVWGRESGAEEKVVDVNVRRLRIKIEEDPTLPVYLSTVWGYGYQWNT